MQPFQAPQSASPAARAANWGLLFGPAVLLAACGLRYDSLLAYFGAMAGVAGGVLIGRKSPAWRPPASGLVIAFNLIAVALVWIASRNQEDGFARFCRGTFLLASIGLIVCHDLVRSGLEPRRRARGYCKAILTRTRWPAMVSEYHLLPEVAALRDAVREDPTPAMRLLTDPRPEVRAAGLLVLHGRTRWRSSEASAVLVAARQASDPVLRAAALNALGSATDPDVIASVAEFLRDPSPEVRLAASLACTTNGAPHWGVVREKLRDALADMDQANDGPLPGAGFGLPAMAVCDLTAWAAEADPLAERAILSLVEHYASALQGSDQHDLPYLIGTMVTDPTTPAALRVELAGLLHEFGLVTHDLLDRMTNSDQPGPVRLLAAEILLADQPDHPDGIDVLRGLGRQPNRETALMIARILQARLGMDMGLPTDGSNVGASTKIAAEAARRVFQWASGRAGEALPPQRGGRPLSTPSLSGLEQTPGPRSGPARGAGPRWSPR